MTRLEEKEKNPTRDTVITNGKCIFVTLREMISQLVCSAFGNHHIIKSHQRFGAIICCTPMPRTICFGMPSPYFGDISVETRRKEFKRAEQFNTPPWSRLEMKSPSQAAGCCVSASKLGPARTPFPIIISLGITSNPRVSRDDPRTEKGYDLVHPCLLPTLHPPYEYHIYPMRQSIASTTTSAEHPEHARPSL